MLGAGRAARAGSGCGDGTAGAGSSSCRSTTARYALAAAGRLPHRGEALTSIAFGMLGAAGQLLARTPAGDRERVRAECRAPFVALLAGLAVSE